MTWHSVYAWLFDMRVLGLAWIFVYGIAVIIVRQVVLFLETGSRQPRIVPVVGALIFAALAVTIFNGLALAGRWVAQPPVWLPSAFFAGWMGLLCTLWALLDGVFVVYVARVHELLAARVSPARGAGEFLSAARRRPVIGLICVSLLLFYLVYFIGAISGCRRQVWDGGDLLSLTFFYARLCYVFWILFEGLLTIVVFRIWRLLRQVPHGAAG